MESANIVRNKTGVLLCGLLCTFLMVQGCAAVCAEESELPDDLKVSDYFSFFGSGGIDWEALNDPNNNPILVACLKGATDESLERLGVLDVWRRLDRLERGNLIRQTDGRYSLAFPAVLGENRKWLAGYVEPISAGLIPVAEGMIAKIRLHLAGRDQMLYHVLWSLIMDGPPAWDTARAGMSEQVKSGDTSIDNKAWLLYPPHPSRAGTNSYSSSRGHLRITWSHNTPSPNAIGRVVLQYVRQIADAIEQDGVVTSADAREALGRYGLVDEAGRVRLHAIKSDSEAAKLYGALGIRFGRQVMNHLDVNKVAEMLDVSPGVAFVIAYHEICWQLLQDLAEKRVLPVPAIVAKVGIEPSEAYQLVSLVIVPEARYPFLETEMSEREKATIKRYNRIKKTIVAGQKYFDLSTPVDALLSYISAGLSNDADTYRKTCAAKSSGSLEFSQEWIDQYRHRCIYRVETWPEQPAEGQVHPIYVMSEQEQEFSDVEVFIYHQGGWGKLFNNGNPRTDWRKAVDWAKRFLK